MILALYQCPSPAGDIAGGLETIDRALALASARGVTMLVMPEAFLPGYQATPADAPNGWEDVEPQIRALCARYSCALTIGLPHYEGGLVFNTALCVSAAGDILARHRKIQLFGPDEAGLYAAGEALTVFDYAGTRFGALICYDVEFPEHVRTLARNGVRVILVPTANMMPFVNINQLLVPARAAENAVTIVYANYCGSEGDLTYTGMSGIFGPDGYQLGAKGGGEGLCIAELPGGWSEHGIPLSTQLADVRDVSKIRT
ncbi:MAG: nitrilase-related carbon-nitrogen hydrolase [Pseudomonadota bacterium]